MNLERLYSLTTKFDSLVVRVWASTSERASLAIVQTRKCHVAAATKQKKNSAVITRKKVKTSPIGLMTDPSLVPGTEWYKTIYKFNCTIWSACRITDAEIAKATAKLVKQKISQADSNCKKKLSCVFPQCRTYEPVPTLDELLDACFSDVGGCVISPSLSAMVAQVLSECMSTTRKRKHEVIKSRQIGICTHRVKASAQKRGQQMMYASLNRNLNWRDRFGSEYWSSLKLRYADSGMSNDHVSLFHNADDAKTHLYLSILLTLNSSIFHQWLGDNRFVILRRPGDSRPFSTICVIFRSKKEVYIGHPDDQLVARFKVPPIM